MLLYQQAFDFHHSLFRILLLLESTRGSSVESEKLRILDFYYLFPHEIASVQLTPLQTSLKRKFLQYPQYEAISNPAKVFYRLEPVFENGLKTLVAAGLVSSESDKKSSKVKLSSEPLPAALKAVITERREKSAELIEFLVGQLLPFPLYGPEGLKARTKLLPSKHDRR